MTAPTARDAERVLHFVAEAEELAGDAPFSCAFLRELARLDRADWAGYVEGATHADARDTPSES